MSQKVKAPDPATTGLEGKEKRLQNAQVDNIPNGLSPQAKWNRQNQKARRAQRKVSYALETGRLEKPNGCEWCGSSGPLDGHHPNYEKPLLVMWLCRSCHKLWHRCVWVNPQEG